MENKTLFRGSVLGGIALFSLMGIFSLGNSTFAKEKPIEDNQLIEKVNEKKLNLEDLKFKQVNSCTNLETVLKKYFKNARYPRYDYMRMKGGLEFDAIASTEKMVSVKGEAKSDGGNSIEHSTTNNQKDGVDEPDIIKNDGNYVYYYNRAKHKIYIIKTPLFHGKLDLEKANFETVINVPKSFNDIQLFIRENKLMILATRWQEYKSDYFSINNNQKTAIIIYDLANKKAPKLERFNDVSGYLKDARLIGEKLYVFSESHLYSPMPYYYRGMEKYENNENNKNNDKKEESKIEYKKFLPKLLDIKVGAKMDFNIYTPDCNNISYVMPDDETLQKIYTNPAITTITVLDIENKNNKPKLTMLLSPTDNIHVSKNSVYLTDYLYFSSRYSCGWGMDCLVPFFDEGNNTLVHKFTIDGMQLDYVNSNVVAGDPLTQYSMDEDNSGNFRILTRKGWNKGTNFYSLDNKLHLLGKIENIEPKENFKASRYIGDKLYLVTYQQIDPLFVVDIADLKNPKIIGALKTPGYSTYLHPFGAEKNGVQYLIGLGYGTKSNGHGGVKNAGVKLSIYKVDYNKKETITSKCSDLEKFPKQYEACKKEVNPNNIAVSTVDEKTYGGQGSYSEVLDNPRLFVMDKNNTLTLPLFLQDRVKNGERCSVYIDDKGVETRKNCYPVEKTITDFIGLKSFALNQQTGIKENFSVNYLKLFKEKIKDSNGNYYYNDDNLWRARRSNMRVGYIGNVLFMINDFFTDFTQNNQHKYLFFQDEK